MACVALILMRVPEHLPDGPKCNARLVRAMCGRERRRQQRVCLTTCARRDRTMLTETNFTGGNITGRKHAHVRSRGQRFPP